MTEPETAAAMLGPRWRSCLFWGEYVNDAGTVAPMNGAMMSSAGSSTAFCITFPYNPAYGSVAVVAGKKGRPPQVTMEALVTGSASDTGWSWINSGHLVATKRQPNVYPTE